MAHSNNSIITGKLTGILGKELVFREWEGKTVVAKAPRARKGEPTLVQAELQERFLMASRYAKGVIKAANAELLEGYNLTLRPRQNLYSRVLEDFMSLPKVKNINTRDYKGAAGDLLVVRAVDDFRVTSVRVEIYAANGTLLEGGDALVGPYGLDWTYTVKQANNLLAGTTIKAIATDVPGNEGTLELIL